MENDSLLYIYTFATCLKQALPSGLKNISTSQIQLSVQVYHPLSDLTLQLLIFNSSEV